MPVFPIKVGYAAENWGLCQLPLYQYVGSNKSSKDATQIEAQEISTQSHQRLELKGDVRFDRAGQNIRADQLTINKTSNTLDALGNVTIETPDYRLQSPRIRLDDKAQTSIFEQPSFELSARHLRGRAAQIEQLGPSNSVFLDLLYTACDPGNKDWHLRAKKMEINQESGRGIAHSTTIYFKGIPFAYLPWLQFPIDDRRLSGLLAPRFGYDGANGNELALPFYWNLSSQYDMTITPTLHGKRGLQLNTENRYLSQHSQGVIDLSYLDDNETDETRWFQKWRITSTLAFDTEAELLLAEVSDEDFFDDFNGVATEYKDTQHLERYLRLTQSNENWQMKLNWQDYQTIDSTTAVADRPYDRLPYLSIRHRPYALSTHSQATVQAEWVNFKRDASVNGTRANLTSTLNWRSSSSWHFVEPELRLNFTDYQLQNNPTANQIDRALASFSVDSGLTFERLIGSRNRWLQTLEPRLFLAHTPHEDQDDIPNFDTALSSNTYNNLFRSNRFTGGDRIGDANQVTIGLGTRLFDHENGNQLLHARIGQIFHLKDRKVSLNSTVDTATRSDAIAEIDINPSNSVRLRSRLVYSQQNSKMAQRDLSIHYAHNGFAANIGYYHDELELEQALISMVYPVNERWTLVAKVQHSLLFDQPVENLLGLNYESCCWGLKILAGQTGDAADDFSESDESIYFEITFKGLSQAGRDIDAELSAAIPGYISGF